MAKESETTFEGVENLLKLPKEFVILEQKKSHTRLEDCIKPIPQWNEKPVAHHGPLMTFIKIRGFDQI